MTLSRVFFKFVKIPLRSFDSSAVILICFQNSDVTCFYNYLKNAISSVPTTISASPKNAFFESFSLKTMNEKATVTRMLSLSIGTTTLTSPCPIA